MLYGFGAGGSRFLRFNGIQCAVLQKLLFATRFSNAEILPPLAAKLNWSHFIELLTPSPPSFRGVLGACRLFCYNIPCIDTNDGRKPLGASTGAHAAAVGGGGRECGACAERLLAESLTATEGNF